MTTPPRARLTGRRDIPIVLASILTGLLAPSATIAVSTPRTIENLTSDWPSNGYTQMPRLSADGRVVAFQGTSNVPFAAPGSGYSQVFALDRGTSTLEQVSVTSGGTGFDDAVPGGVSGNGRYVTFTAESTAIPGGRHAYLRDRASGTTTQLDVAVGGGVPDGVVVSGDVDVSDDGTIVVFSSTASNLLPPGEDTNGTLDVFAQDVASGLRQRLSIDPSSGTESNGHSYGVAINGSGTVVAFISTATNLLGAGGDTNGRRDAYVYDSATSSIERVSVADDESEANGDTQFATLSLSADGSVVAFDSGATNLVAGDTNNRFDVFVRNRTAGTTVRASVRNDGSEPPTRGDSYSPSISGDGTKVAFTSTAKLDPGKNTDHQDVFLRDLVAGTTELISRTPSGSGGDSLSGELINGTNLSMSADGNLIAFGSWASDLTTPAASPQSPDVLLSRPRPADADGDGITDDVDTNPGVVSRAFDDGDGNFGSIVTIPVGFTVSVHDSVDPTDGFHITVTGTGVQKVQIFMCGVLTLRLAAGSVGDFGCGSVIVAPAAASPPVEAVIGDGLAIVTIPAGAKAEVDATPDGGFSVENVTGGAVSVTVDGQATTVQPGSTLTGNAWHFAGFSAPIDNGGVLNAAKAGRTIPVKWRVTDAVGRPVVSLTTARLTVATLTCPAGVTVDQVEEYTTGASGLVNEGNGYYHLNWATPSGYANSCKTMRLDIGDGVLHTALFKFAK